MIEHACPVCGGEAVRRSMAYPQLCVGSFLLCLACRKAHLKAVDSLRKGHKVPDRRLKFNGYWTELQDLQRINHFLPRLIPLQYKKRRMKVYDRLIRLDWFLFFCREIEHRKREERKVDAQCRS